MKICHACQQTYSDDIEFCPRDGARLAVQATETEAQLAAGLSRRYRIVRRLGQGGMGAVFLVEQIGVGNRPVALKVLNRKLLDDPDFLLRFQNEAASTGRIRHANVVTIHESAQADDGTPYIAMEFLEGESLREVLQQRGALPVAEVTEILQQAARGLNAAHKLGIIHRDLKPDNIFLTHADDDSVAPVSPPANVQVKIVDFGIAKLRESATHTQTGMVLGTPAYMSYEQASGMRSDELDARSDIYSLGVVVYEMLSGRVPFHSDTPVGYLRKHLMDEPPPFRAVAPALAIPAQVEAVVMKALTKDREQRFASVLDFARDFARAATAQVATESPTPIAAPKRAEPAMPPPPDVGARRRLAPAEAGPPAQAQGAVGRRTASPLQTPPGPPPLPPGAVRDPSRLDQDPPRRALGAAAQPRKTSRVGIASVVAAVVLVIVAVLIWVNWPRSINPPGPQPGAAQQETTGPASVPSAGPVRVNPRDGLKYVWIAPGTFTMGCSPGDNECGGDEKPAHQVTISKGFWLGQTPVTVGAYKRFAQGSGKSMPPEPQLMDRPLNSGWTNEAMPIVDVTWKEAHEYCAWAGGRLPTEAEWEYAARGGSNEARYGPLDNIAWYADNSGRERLDSAQIFQTDQANYEKRLNDNGDGMHDVGRKRPNRFGLYDILGNVWEWVNDWYDQNYYQNSPSQDPSGPSSGQVRVLRGGSWGFFPRGIRVSVRSWDGPVGRLLGDGFRCSGEVF